METRLPFVSLLAMARNTRAAARASHAPHLLEVTTKVGSGYPSFGGQRTVASARKRKSSERLSQHLSLSIEAPNFGPVSSHQSPGPGASSEHGSVSGSARPRAHPALVCFGIQIQGTAVSPRAWPNPSFKRTRLRRSA